jgi:hypothetical protein
MGWTLVIPTAALLLAAGVVQWRRAREFRRLYRRSDRNPDLRAELESLPRKDRWRIIRAARMGKKLEDPQEARLAVDSAERQLAILEIVNDAPRLRVGIGLGFLLLGAVSGVLPLAGLGLVIVAIELHSIVYRRRLFEHLKQAARANR